MVPFQISILSAIQKTESEGLSQFEATWSIQQDLASKKQANRTKLKQTKRNNWGFLLNKYKNLGLSSQHPHKTSVVTVYVSNPTTGEGEAKGFQLQIQWEKEA